MSSVTQPIDQTDVPTLTSDFLVAAAALESRLYDTQRHVESLTRALLRAQARQQRAVAWIMAARRSHRSRSHAFTAKLFRHALADLTTFDTMPTVGLSTYVTPTSLLKSVTKRTVHAPVFHEEN